jgi:formylglycine-generating enzyme
MNARLSRRGILFLVTGACCLAWACGVSGAKPDASKSVEARVKKMDPFYKQHVTVDSLLIAGSEKVSRHALDEVAYLAQKMLANRPDVLKGFTRQISVMAYSEMQTALPDCRGLAPWWDYRARGLAGATISCGEENVLSFKGDPWKGENIFIHEFAHGLNGYFNSKDKGFQTRLNALHAKAQKSGLFEGYGISSASEFWAEGVQAWFNCNGTIRPESGGGQSSFEVLNADGNHVAHINTRKLVKTHLPGLAEFIDETFKQNQWVYTPVSKRLKEPHLKGFNPAKAPTFVWPEGVVEAFHKAEALKKAQAARKWAKVSPKQVAAAKALGVPVAFENSIGMKFVLIPAGEFMMGSKDSPAQVAKLCAMSNAQAGWFYSEQPQHKVTLTKAYYMSIHELTQGIRQTPLGSKGGRNRGKKPAAKKYPEGFEGPNMPASSISWRDADVFCKALTKQESRTYALPTEAQWEYACRAGTETPFSFGATISTGQANYHGDYIYGPGKKGKNREKPAAVGTMKPNAWGLYDMHGNVSEWCSDVYGPYPSDAVSDPTGPTEGREYALRGGSWRSYPGACRSAFRANGSGGSNNIGLRIVCAIATKSKDGK